jgi:hypothetical protein
VGACIQVCARGSGSMRICVRVGVWVRGFVDNLLSVQFRKGKPNEKAEQEAKNKP